MTNRARLTLVLLFAAWTPATQGQPVRALPRPLPSHPGNVFCSGEDVSMPQPPGGGTTWRLLDYEGRAVAEKASVSGMLHFGKLPVGWYELRPSEEGAAATNWASLAVLESLRVSTPTTSPVSLDVAMAWFYPTDRMPQAASLCALAGVNWVRDRLNWGEVEPERGRYAGASRYDNSCRAQASAGLRQLQVNHISPKWANPRNARFPTDLRDAHHFYREAASRWKGGIEAFEPWNEPDIEMFGGHTGGEIASFQKASFLGLKAGNPNLIVCQSVFALNQRVMLEDFNDNQAWPYFDTFNLHHYVAFDAYPGVYADFRSISAGKPLWVTECALPVQWSGDESAKEPSPSDLRVQSERVAKVFASSLHEVSAAVFYFLLPHYVEGKTQFGIVRRDLTPRPAYVALAAVGRLLADAKPLGRLVSGPSQLRAYVFHAVPDGRKQELLVAWVTDGAVKLPLPVAPLAVFDHLGRQLPAQGQELEVTVAPKLVTLPPGTHTRLALEQPPKTPNLRNEAPSPVVLQAIVPEDRLVLKQSSYKLDAGRTNTVSIRLYNFSERGASGRFEVDSPPSWNVSFPRNVDLGPEEMKEAVLSLLPPPDFGKSIERVRVQGAFGDGGHPVLSLRFVGERK